MSMDPDVKRMDSVRSSALETAMSQNMGKLRQISEGVYVPVASKVSSISLPGSGMEQPNEQTSPYESVV